MLATNWRFFVLPVLSATALFPVAAVLVLLPGMLPALALRRKLEASSVTVVPMAAGISIAALGLIAQIAYFAHASLTLALAAFGLVSLVAAALLWRRHDWRELRWQRQPWLIAAVACVFSLLEGAWTSGDSAYHLAAARSLLVFDRPLVTDPYYGMTSAPIDAISGSWHTMMAFASRVTTLDVLTLWPALTAIGTAVLVLGFWSLAEEAAGSAKAASAVTIGLLLIYYTADFRWMGYPGYMSRGLLFIAIWAMLRALARPSAAAAIAVALLGSGASAVHLGTAEMYACVALAALVAGGVAAVQGWRAGGTARKAWGVLAIGVVGAAASVAPITVARISTISAMDIAPVGFELWRGYQKVLPGVYLHRPLYIKEHIGLFAIGTVPTVLLGVASSVVLGLMIREAFRLRDAGAWGRAAVVAVPIVLALPPLSLLVISRSEYMLVRLLDVLDCLLLVGVAWALARNRLWRHVSARRIAILYLAVALLCSVAGLVGLPSRVHERWMGERRLTYWKPGALDRLGRIVGPGCPRIASDVNTGYSLLAFEPVSLVAGHPVHSPYYVELTDGEKRRQDMARLLEPSASEQDRVALMRRWDARFVLISPATPKYKLVLASLRAQSASFPEVMSSERLWLFAFADPQRR